MPQHRIVYVTYADGAYEANLKINAFFARHFLGAAETVLLTRKDLETDEIYNRNREVFDAEKGRGYWAWKPWAILRALERGRPGDIVIYQDCGFGLRYKSFIRPKKLIELALANDFIAGIYTPHYGPNSKWNHRKCLESIVRFDTQYLSMPTLEAVVSVWPAGSASTTFVRDWLAHCLQLELISDPPSSAMEEQHPDFVEHRYDQAILTNLVAKQKKYGLAVHPSILRYAKSISILEIDLRARDSIIFRAVRVMLTRGFDFFHASRRTLTKCPKRD